MKIIVAAILLVLSVHSGSAQSADWDREAYLVPAEQRARFRNPDGSCVQCSIAIAGVHHANLNAEMLLWKSEFGPAQRGGSGPSRVESYAKARGLQVYNITDNTMPWIEWALSTGRYAAIGFDSNHFQTAVGMEPDRSIFYVVDNNSTHKVQIVTRQDFIRRHRASGEWCVIPKGPAPPAWVGPQFKEWWKDAKPLPRPDVPKPVDGNLGFDVNLF